MRYRSVIDMHFVNRMQAFGWQLIVAAFALAIILVVGVIVSLRAPDAQLVMYDGMTWSAAIFALLGPVIGRGFPSMGHYSPLAPAMGLTRREFATGLSIVFLGYSSAL